MIQTMKTAWLYTYSSNANTPSYTYHHGLYRRSQRPRHLRDRLAVISHDAQHLRCRRVDPD